MWEKWFSERTVPRQKKHWNPFWMPAQKQNDCETGWAHREYQLSNMTYLRVKRVGLERWLSQLQQAGLATKQSKDCYLVNLTKWIGIMWIHHILKSSKGYRDSSVAKSTDCSSRGPGFNSPKPHGHSQPSVTLVTENLTPSSGLLWALHTHSTHTFRQNTQRHKIK